MVENSVGRLWIEHLRAVDETLDESILAANFGWKYYLPEAKQELEVEAELKKLRKERTSLTPEQITMIESKTQNLIQINDCPLRGVA